MLNSSLNALRATTPCKGKFCDFINLQQLYFYFRMIEAALTADPTNTELLQLQSDLNTLITLTKQSIGTLSSNDKVIQ